MSLSFQDLYNVRNYFFCACFTGRKMKYRKKSHFFHGYVEHLKRTRNWVSRVLALPTNYCLVLSPSQFHFLWKRGREILVAGFRLNAKQFVILKIILYYFMYHSILVFLYVFSYNKLVLYSGYICMYKNTWMYPKCTWKQQWWFLKLRQLLQVLCVCDQCVTYTETQVSVFRAHFGIKPRNWFLVKLGTILFLYIIDGIGGFKNCN